jgi:predicted cupin superfamily sugar epimerase
VSDANEAVRLLGLVAHPEGGWYRETWRDSPEAGGRGAGTAIYYLLRTGEVSHWHRVDATEVWHFYAGEPLELSLSADGASVERLVLGTDLTAGERPQHVVPAGVWQSARPLGAWALVGCTVSPAFEFPGFELAPDGWQPDRTGQ